jgi:hypothetical protein
MQWIIYLEREIRRLLFGERTIFEDDPVADESIGRRSDAGGGLIFA